VVHTHVVYLDSLVALDISQLASHHEREVEEDHDEQK